MPRKPIATFSENIDIRSNINRTSVVAVAVSDYQYLKKLEGVVHDLRMVDEFFSANSMVGLYASRYSSLLNPTAAEFRRAIIDYALSRSARGDILILYFSGHGAILGATEFAFCLRDTSLGADRSKILALSSVRFRDIIQTLSSVDIYPIFILDACFSGLAASQGTVSATAGMHDTLHTYFAGSYGLLVSSSIDSQSFDSAFGGTFTRALHSIIINGLEDDLGRHMPFLTLSNLSPHLQERLAKEGRPLSRCYIGPDMPQVPVAKNIKFNPTTIKFSPYMKRIVEYIWNNGNPREVTIDVLLNHVGKGAYANHSKLSLTPWELLEDGNKKSTRRLTKRGIQFAKGEIKIPKVIIKDSITWDWIPAPDTDLVSIKKKKEQ